MLSTLGSLLLIAVIAVLPVMLAAKFVGAERDNFVFSALAVVVATAIAFAGYKVVGGSLPGLAVAFLGMMFTYSVVLKTSLGSAFGLTIIAFALQIGVVFGLASLGLSITQRIMS